MCAITTSPDRAAAMRRSAAAAGNEAPMSPFSEKPATRKPSADISSSASRL